MKLTKFQKGVARKRFKAKKSTPQWVRKITDRKIVSKRVYYSWRRNKLKC